MKRRDFLKTAGLCSLATAIPGCSQALRRHGSERNRPNIIFIMSDDHGSQALSSYGSQLNATPHIDRIATEGMRFNNCFCTNSLCSPSRAVVITGKYSHKNGVRGNNKNGFNGSQQTLPKLLKNAGYQTAIIGKWHLQTEPTGFDYWHVLPGQGVYHNPTFNIMGKTVKRQGYLTDIITDESINWIRNRNQHQPFFLMCHFKAPHVPHDFDDKYAQRYNDDLPEPVTLQDDYSTRSSAPHKAGKYYSLEITADLKEKPPQNLDGPSRRQWNYQKFFKGYLKVIASMDDNIGRLLAFLDRNGLTRNTIVVYTTDNGFFIGDHGWYNKMWVYEESIHLPLLIRYPKEIPPGSVSNDFVMNLDYAPTLLDYAPTLLDYAGVPIPGDIQGKSFRCILNGTTKDGFRDAVYYHYYRQYGVPGHYGVRTKQYKLIYYYSTDEWEFFDLAKDPREVNNLFGNPKYKSIISNLKLELRRLRKQYDDTEFDFKI